MRCHGLDPHGDVRPTDPEEKASQPLVSVIMGAFNCADTLPSAIESILRQTYTNLELVVCDDGSSDATLEVARACAARDRRVVVIQNESNLGLAATLNRCLDVARGELVARMDGDDLCDPTRIRRQVDALASSPEVSVVGSATYYFDECGIWGSGEVAALPTKRGLVRGTPFVHGSVAFRRHAVAEVGNYSESPARRRVEDFDLWVRLYAAGHRGINISEPLYGLRNDRDAAGRRSIGARLKRGEGDCRSGQPHRPFEVALSADSAAARPGTAARRLVPGPLPPAPPCHTTVAAPHEGGWEAAHLDRIGALPGGYAEVHAMNRVIAGIAHVATGNTLAQGVVIVSSLVIARYVAPAQFGPYAAIIAVTSVLGVFASLRFELAVPIPLRRDEAHDVLRVTILAALVNTGLFGAVGAVLYAAGVLQRMLHVTVLTMVLALASVVLIGMFNGLNQMALRERRYRVVATRVVVQALVVVATQITLVILSPSTASLLAGQVAGQVVGVLLLARGVDLSGTKSPPLRVVSAYRAFPLVAAPSAVVNTLGLQIPLVLGTALWGATFAGWFGMTQRLLALPVAVLGAAIGQVFIGEFSSRLRARDVRLQADFYRTSLVLALVGVAVAAMVMALGPTIFALGLGEKYRESGVFAQALAVGLAGQLLAGPLGVMLPLLGRQLWQGAWDVTRLLATGVVLWGADVAGRNANQALWILGGFNAILYLALWLLVRKAVRVACANFVPRTEARASMRVVSSEREHER